MRHGSGALRLLGLVLVMLVLTGVGPARSVAEGPTVTLADDFQSGPGSVWRLQRVLADALKSVPDPAGQDRNVLPITLRTGDMAESGGVAERAELSEDNRLHLPTGTDVWYSFQLYIPTDFPVVDRRLVLGQWKQACGDCAADHSPAIANRYRNGVFSITIQEADKRVVLFEEKADIRGRWNQLVYHLKLTPTPDGFLQAWLEQPPGRRPQGPAGVPGRSRQRVLQDRSVSRHPPLPDDDHARPVPSRDHSRRGRSLGHAVGAGSDTIGRADGAPVITRSSSTARGRSFRGRCTGHPSCRRQASAPGAACGSTSSARTSRRPGPTSRAAG